MADHIQSIAVKYGIDPNVFRRLVQQESGGNQNAVSPKGAIGRTQLLPSTAASLGVNPHDPIGNLVGGARYLKQQLDHFGGDYRKALAAYNAGPGAVEKYGGVPPYAETQNYVRSILGGRTPSASSHSTSSSPPTPSTRTTTRTTPGVDRSPERRALILNWLQNQHQPGALVSLAQGLQGAKDTPGKTVTASSSVATPSGRVASGHLPVAQGGKLIGQPYQGTHTLGNWQSDRAYDIAVPEGTPMVAVQDGTVVKVTKHPQGAGRFAGDQVTVRGANGNEYFYAHGVASVQAGQRVRKGQKLGVTGSANGIAHLHFAQMKGDPSMHVR